MKILHTADLHLGRQFNGLSLFEDQEVILEQIIEALNTHQPDVLIIAGDIFDRAVPPQQAVRQFNSFMRKVMATGTAIVLIAGNHDSGDRIDSMAVMTAQDRALIRGPISAEEYPLILHDNDGKVAFSALPFAYEYSARQILGDETLSSPEDVLRAQIAAAKRHVPEGMRWVVVAHGFISGASASEAERPLARVGGIETVNADIFDGAHYIALGHLHHPQNVGTKHIRYAGAPLAFGFDEAGDEKSMSLVEMDSQGNVSITALAFKPMRNLRIIEGLFDDIIKQPPSTDIIKIILHDKERLIDPMKRLREKFPYACQLSYLQRTGTKNDTHSLRFEKKQNDPLGLIDDFLAYVRDENLSQSENELAKIVLMQSQTEGDGQ